MGTETLRRTTNGTDGEWPRRRGASTSTVSSAVEPARYAQHPRRTSAPSRPLDTQRGTARMSPRRRHSPAANGGIGCAKCLPGASLTCYFVQHLPCDPPSRPATLPASAQREASAQRVRPRHRRLSPLAQRADARASPTAREPQHELVRPRETALDRRELRGLLDAPLVRGAGGFGQPRREWRAAVERQRPRPGGGLAGRRTRRLTRQHVSVHSA